MIRQVRVLYSMLYWELDCKLLANIIIHEGYQQYTQSTHKDSLKQNFNGISSQFQNVVKDGHLTCRWGILPQLAASASIPRLSKTFFHIIQRATSQLRCCNEVWAHEVCLELKVILDSDSPSMEHSAQCAMSVPSRAPKEIGLE